MKFRFFFKECLFKKYLNIYCPGCGGTRMIKAILRQDFYQAFRYNPLIFICIVLGIGLIIINILLWTRKKKLIIPKERDLIIFAIVLILYFILRNIPLFEFLVPTKV